MALKDYYDILEVEPSATLPEIKRSFRKLAHQFHPDKNPADAYAAARFYEIKEAHEVLTNPSKKTYYLQQRWYNHSTGNRKKQGPLTPENTLKQFLELERYVSTLDKFRMDKQGLGNYLLELMSNETIATLQQFKEPEITIHIIRSILRVTDHITNNTRKHIVEQLNNLASENEVAEQLIQAYTIKANKKQQSEKYSLLFITLLTIIICMLIYLAGS